MLRNRISAAADAAEDIELYHGVNDDVYDELNDVRGRQSYRQAYDDNAYLLPVPHRQPVEAEYLHPRQPDIARDVSTYERYKPPRDADTARNDHVYELQHKTSAPVEVRLPMPLPASRPPPSAVYNGNGYVQLLHATRPSPQPDTDLKLGQPAHVKENANYNSNGQQGAGVEVLTPTKSNCGKVKVLTVIAVVLLVLLIGAAALITYLLLANKVDNVASTQPLGSVSTTVSVSAQADDKVAWVTPSKQASTTGYLNGCVSSPCKNGGTCLPALSSYSCVCRDGYTGTNCEQVGVRLSDSSSEGDEFSGRVEVFKQGQWGTVCKQKFDAPDALVVCRQLGFAKASVLPSSAVTDGRSEDPVWLDELECSGSEATLFECPRNSTTVDCYHNQDVGVKCEPARDCEDLYKEGKRSDGVYRIWPKDVPASTNVTVYCEMSNGGWTRIQHRSTGYLDFNKSWNSLAQKMGNVAGEHWLGNDIIHALTYQDHYSMRWDVVYDSEPSRTQWAEFREFNMQSAEDGYALNVDEWNDNSTVGHNFVLTNSYNKWSTADSDNDGNSTVDCVQARGGPWWYGSHCESESNLNSRAWTGGVCSAATCSMCISVAPFPCRPVRSTTMKMRRQRD